MSLDLHRAANAALPNRSSARFERPSHPPGKLRGAMLDLAHGTLPRDLRKATASAMMGVAAIGGVGAATTSADAGIVRDPYSVWDPYARAQGQNYLAGGPGLQGGGAVALRITGTSAGGVIGTRNTSAIFLGNYYDSNQGGMRSLFVTAEHNIADFYTASDVTSSVRTGSNFNSDPGQVVGVNRWITGNMSASRNPSMRDYSFFWGDTTVAGNNVVFGTASGNLAFVGYGRSASEAQGNLGQDGNVRAVFSPLGTGVSFGFNPEFFKQGVVNSFNTLAGLGRTYQLDSGCLVADSFGRIVGMGVAGSVGTGFDGVSVFQSFGDDPVFMAQFNELTVPSPGAIAVLGAAMLVGSRGRRRS
jgi:hypothetical protein